MKKIAVIGSTNVDLITHANRFAKDSETLEAESFCIGNGCKVANQDVAAARLGSHVLMLLKVRENQKVNSIDTSDANDAFISCFSHFFTETGDVQLAIEKAPAFAARSVTGKGVQSSFPTVEAFNEFQKIMFN